MRINPPLAIILRHRLLRRIIQHLCRRHGVPAKLLKVRLWQPQAQRQHAQHVVRQPQRRVEIRVDRGAEVGGVRDALRVQVGPAGGALGLDVAVGGRVVGAKVEAFFEVGAEAAGEGLAAEGLVAAVVVVLVWVVG